MNLGLKSNEKYCDFCVLIVPADHDCPVSKRMAENPIELSSPGIVWNCSGGTRGFSGGRGTRIPNMNNVVPNPGNQEPTTGMLGLSDEQVAQLGL